MGTRFNLRRGFNRIYLVITIVWCLYVLWYPVKARNKEYIGAYNYASSSFDGCRALPGNSYQQCWDKQHAMEAEAKRDILDPNPYLRFTGGSYVLLLFLPAAMVIPPAIIYGLLFALVKLVLWIINGFRA
jgi:hypothetical protein